MIDLFQQVTAPAQRQQVPEYTDGMISTRRELAKRLLEGASNTSPVGHWTQAAARAFDGLVGSMGAYRADDMERAKLAAATSKGGADNAAAAELLMSLYPGAEQPQAAPQGAPVRAAGNGGPMRQAPVQQAAPQPQAQPMQGMPSRQQLQALLANPSTRSYGMEIYKKIMERQLPPDPMAQAELELKRAQVAKMQREAQGGAESTEYALMPQYAQDDQGNFVPWVPGKSGTPKVIDLPPGLKALAPADTAFQRAYGKEKGEAVGTAQIDLPRQVDNAGLALQTIDAIRKHPGRGAGTGMTAPLGMVPGTKARGFANLVDQAKGQVFLEAFNSLRGGGQITEAEGAKATQALARLDRYQGEADFNAALSDLEDVIKAGLSRAQVKANGGVQSAPVGVQGGVPGGLQAGEYVYNPATGRVEPKR